MAAEDFIDAVLDRPKWHKQALCRGMPVRWFFPEEHEQRALQIRGLCDECPVQNDCLEYALQFDVMPGIWGGLGGPARRKIRSDRYRESLRREAS